MGIRPFSAAKVLSRKTRSPSNVADRWLRFLIASPVIYRMDHSRVRVETDSNSSSIFSFWDRIGGTFQLCKYWRPVDFGLAQYGSEKWQRVRGLLTTPFQIANS
jgi:sterol desaturase/sphingolipid hydroxylase (fatty acid hydroxylase superfamily)